MGESGRKWEILTVSRKRGGITCYALHPLSTAVDVYELLPGYKFKFVTLIGRIINSIMCTV